MMKLLVYQPVDAQYNLCYLISALLIYIYMYQQKIPTLIMTSSVFARCFLPV